MPIRLTDFLAAPSRGTTTQAMAYAVTQRAERQGFLAEYFAELYRLCAKYQFDFAILVAQSANETGKWKSAVWKQYGNPAGIGVTGTDTTSGPNLSLVYVNGKEAARAHVVHMFAYVRGPITTLAGELHDYIDLDPRYDAVFKAKYGGTITTIEDFNVNGRWALLNNPPPYGNRIVTDGLAAWPGLPDQDDPPVEIPTTPEEPLPDVTFGRVPKPPATNRVISNSRAWDDLGKRTIRGVVWHRIYGSLWGTDSYFRGEAIGRALTDYGVGVTTTDGIENDGVALMWNDPTGNRSPWASGPVRNPVDDGAAFVARYGKNAVNRDLVSIEISGTSGSTALSPKARAWVVAMTAYWADQYKVSWETFPLVPDEGRSFVFWHGEFYDGKRGTCPGPVVENATPAMLDEVKALLKQYQSGDVTTPEPEPEPEPTPTEPEIVPGVDWGIAKRAFDNTSKPELKDFVLSKGGPLSTLYLDRVKRDGVLPQLTDRWRYDDGRVYYRFGNGWLALFTEKDKAIRWIEEVA